MRQTGASNWGHRSHDLWSRDLHYVIKNKEQGRPRRDSNPQTFGTGNRRATIAPPGPFLEKREGNLKSE